MPYRDFFKGITGMVSGFGGAILAAVSAAQDQITWVVGIIAATGGAAASWYMIASMRSGIEKNRAERDAANAQKSAEFAERDLYEAEMYRIQRNEVDAEKALRDRLRSEMAADPSGPVQ